MPAKPVAAPPRTERAGRRPLAVSSLGSRAARSMGPAASAGSGNARGFRHQTGADDRERAPERPAPAPEADSSTREFDYLVTKLKPRLVVQHSKVIDDGTVFELKGGATIGRSPRSQIVLPDDYVSSTHARIFARKQFLFLEDLGSTNGTFIDGRRVEGEHPDQAGAGDRHRRHDLPLRGMSPAATS